MIYPLNLFGGLLALRWGPRQGGKTEPGLLDPLLLRTVFSAEARAGRKGEGEKEGEGDGQEAVVRKEGGLGGLRREGDERGASPSSALPRRADLAGNVSQAPS